MKGVYSGHFPLIWKKTCETVDLLKICISDSETTGAAYFKTLADILSIPEALQTDKEKSNL